MDILQKAKHCPNRGDPYFLGLTAAWSVILIVSLIWNIHHEREDTLEAAHIQAEIAYNKDLIYRRWNTEHGGVYVPVNEKTRPNPYLDMPERDITTPSGRKLTLMNPAYMTRQVHELGAKAYGIRGHITSLRPIRPENAPDPWEAQSLEAIQRGAKEFSSVEAIEGQDYMRLMRPLPTEEECIKCHAAQGYKVGDIRGGISVSVPMAPLWAIERSRIITLSIAHGLLLLLGIAGIKFFAHGWGQRILERDRAEKALERLNRELEELVEQRTAELVRANERLKHEIEDRKQLETMLRESEARYKGIVEYTRNGVAVYKAVNDGQDFIIVEFNKAAEKIDKVKRNTLIGKNVTEIFPGVKDFGLFEVFQRVWTTGKSEYFPVSIYSDERLTGWRENFVYKLPSGEIVAIYSDETERKRAEEKIQKSKATLQAVFDGISDPLLMVGKDMSVKILNRSAAEYYQVKSQDVNGKPCYQAFRAGSNPCAGCDIPSAVSHGKPATFERKGVADSDRVEQVVIYPLKEKEGEEGSAIIRISDITEAKLLQRQVIQSEKMASLGLLVAGVAHEINNPNNFIAFNLPILRDYLKELIPILDDYAQGHPDFELFGMSYPEFRKDIFNLLDNVEHGSRRINTIVSDLREFASSRDKSESRLVDLKPVIEKGVAICRGEIKKKVKFFEMNIPEDLPPIFTEPQALDQVLVNLLINAAHAADKEDSWVRLNVKLSRAPGDHLIIEVSDNGCGMDEETLGKIFDPFFTTKPIGKGTGLGLFVCHSLIEGLGGRIEVESEVGKGSTFRVVLQKQGVQS
jgi:signal transduction histidine kinase